MKTREQRIEWGKKGAAIRWAKEPPAAERFWANVNIRSPAECWNWIPKSRHPFGYGKWKKEGRCTNAHRYAYELANGPIPASLWVCHDCDNPACCNPAHLKAKPPRENVEDCVKRGRLRTLRGKDHPRFGTKRPGELAAYKKLTQLQVNEIRSLYATGGYTQKQLAELFGTVGQDQISRIVNHKAWDC